MIKLLGVAAVTLAATAAPAFAHLDPAHNGSFLAGASHPLFGLDHILAMVAVGLWAAMIGGRAVWIVPSAFVGAMAAGFVLTLLGAPLPFVEPVILASVVALGILIAAAVNLPVVAGAALVGAFALFHGHAHGNELGAAEAFPYMLGFALATAFLHIAGIGLGLALGYGKETGRRIVQACGAVCAALGIGLLAGAL